MQNNPVLTKLVTPPKLSEDLRRRALTVKEVRYILSGPNREKPEGARDGFLLLTFIYFHAVVYPPNKPAVTVKNLEKYMDRFSTFTDFGGAALVMKGDKIPLRKAYGHDGSFN